MGFQQQEREDSQNSNKYPFFRLPVTSAQCIIGTENYADAAILLYYEDDAYNQGHGQTEEVFRVLTKDDIVQP